MARNGTFKVFLLAGQTNMEGKAPNALLEHQATDGVTKELFAHLRKADNFVKFLDNFGAVHAENGTVQVDVFAPGQVWMEPCADFQ